MLIPTLSRQAEELGYELADEDLESRELIETDYRNVAEVPDDVRERLPTSFDVIGDVAIVRLEDDLVDHADKVGEAFMRTFPRLRTVALDQGVKGFRVRDLKVIAGALTETIHQEYGIRQGRSAGNTLILDGQPTQANRTPLSGRREGGGYVRRCRTFSS